MIEISKKEISYLLFIFSPLYEIIWFIIGFNQGWLFTVDASPMSMDLVYSTGPLWYTYLGVCLAGLIVLWVMCLFGIIFVNVWRGKSE